MCVCVCVWVGVCVCVCVCVCMCVCSGNILCVCCVDDGSEPATYKLPSIVLFAGPVYY